MRTSLLILAALLVALPSTASAKTLDVVACAESSIAASALCDVGFGPSCTSTTACIGADVAETKKLAECVGVECVWLPDCLEVKVWYQDWPDNPTVDVPECLQVSP